MSWDPRKELGVERGAAADDVKRAYRRRSKESHPDHGGDPDEFRRVNLAYEILIDEDRLKRYDQTGDTTAPRDLSGHAALALADMFVAAVHEVREWRTVDLREVVRQALAHSRALLKASRQERARLATEYAAASSRVRTANGRPNLAKEALENAAANEIKVLDVLDAQRDLLDAMDRILPDYEWSTDDARRIGWGGASQSQSGLISYGAPHANFWK